MNLSQERIRRFWVIISEVLKTIEDLCQRADFPLSDAQIAIIGGVLMQKEIIRGTKMLDLLIEMNKLGV